MRAGVNLAPCGGGSAANLRVHTKLARCAVQKNAQACPQKERHPCCQSTPVAAGVPGHAPECESSSCTYRYDAYRALYAEFKSLKRVLGDHLDLYETSSACSRADMWE